MNENNKFVLSPVLLFVYHSVLGVTLSLLLFESQIINRDTCEVSVRVNTKLTLSPRIEKQTRLIY